MTLLERLGDPREDFGELSQGMQRRLSFALALATSPELLLLDEIWRFVESGAHEGGASDGARTVVFATHNLEDVTDIADHVLLVADGQCLGPYELDALVDGWRAFYVNGETGDLPGVVEVEGRNPARLISNAPRKTVEALIASNIPVIDESSVALEEILFHLVRRSIAGALSEGEYRTPNHPGTTSNQRGGGGPATRGTRRQGRAWSARQEQSRQRRPAASCWRS